MAKYNVDKRPVGRPPRFTEEFCDKMADSLREWFEKAKADEKMFWFKDWIFANDMIPQDMQNLCENSKKFNEIYRVVKNWQQGIVEKGAIDKRFSSNFTAFYLSHNYDDYKSAKPEAKLEQTLDQLKDSLLDIYKQNQVRDDD